MGHCTNRLSVILSDNNIIRLVRIFAPYGPLLFASVICCVVFTKVFLSGTKATIALTVPRIVSMGGICNWFFVLPNRRDNQFIVLLSLGTIRLIRKSILC